MFKWVLQNKSTHAWDQGGVILRNHCNDDARVTPVKITRRLKPNEITEVNVTVYIPKDISIDKIILLFQFENENGDRFGDSLIGIIDIDLGWGN